MPSVAAWRRDQGLVNHGDTTAAARRKAPQRISYYVDAGRNRRARLIPVEEYWYYSNGSRPLAQELRFHNGAPQGADTPCDGHRPAAEHCTPPDF